MYITKLKSGDVPNLGWKHNPAVLESRFGDLLLKAEQTWNFYLLFK